MNANEQQRASNAPLTVPASVTSSSDQSPTQHDTVAVADTLDEALDKVPDQDGPAAEPAKAIATAESNAPAAPVTNALAIDGQAEGEKESDLDSLDMRDEGRGPFDPCITCGDDEYPTILECPVCGCDFCTGCVIAAFTVALQRPVFSPASCCVIFQLHHGLAYLEKEEADLYKARFTEWLTRDRVYCPNRTCSAFIPPNIVQPVITPPRLPLVSLEDIAALLKSVLLHPTSPGSKLEPVRVPGTDSYVSLQYIESNLVKYSNLNAFLTDLYLALTHAANPIKDTLLKSLTTVLNLDPPQTSAISCPKCKSSICLKCKSLSDHGSSPCAKNAEWLVPSMFRTSGYKACPKCGIPSKKIEGCNHLDCSNCDANWCWSCSRASGLCGPNCDYEDESDEPEDDNTSQADANLNESIDLRTLERDSGYGAAGAEPLATSTKAYGHVKVDIFIEDAASEINKMPVTRELMGEGRPFLDIWDCPHAFASLRQHGIVWSKGIHVPQCSRCFKHLYHRVCQPSMKGVNKSSTRKLSDLAWTCLQCNIMYCNVCRARSMNEYPGYYPGM